MELNDIAKELEKWQNRDPENRSLVLVSAIKTERSPVGDIYDINIGMSGYERGMIAALKSSILENKRLGELLVRAIKEAEIAIIAQSKNKGEA